MKKKQLVIVLLVIIMLISVISFVKFTETGSENDKTQYIFEMNVDTNETNNYTIIIPIAKDNDGLMFEINDYKTVKGNVSLNYDDTKYGKGLKIEGNGSFSLKAKKNNTKLVEFTMANESVDFTDTSRVGEYIGYWHYLNDENQTLDIEMHCREIGEAFNYPRFDIEGELNNSNWVLIDGKYSMRVKN